MYKKDYILTMAEQLAQFLARVLFLRETRRLDVAMVEIEDFAGKVFGVSLEKLRTMTHEDLLTFCSHDGVLQLETATSLGRLLKETGDIERLEEKPALPPCEYYTRALVLLLSAYGDGTVALPLDALGTIDILIERIEGCAMPSSMLALLFPFFEGTTAYADAENVLFEMVELGVPNAVAAGMAFYDRLLLLDDDALAYGGLPRAEVEEGRRTLLSRSA